MALLHPLSFTPDSSERLFLRHPAFEYSRRAEPHHSRAALPYSHVLGF